MRELIKNVIDWANERNLIHEENAIKQYLKVIEEVGETARSIIKNDLEGTIDGFGDIAVTIIILYAQLNKGKEIIYYNNELPQLDLFSDLLRHVTEDYCANNALAVLSQITERYGLNLEQCLESAYNEIKNRKGKTINGNFIKDENN